MIECVCSPVPHVEGVHSVVSVTGSVELTIPWVSGIGFLIFGYFGRICGIGQHFLKEIYIAWVVSGIESQWGGMSHDDDTSFPYKRFAYVHVKQVAETETGYEDWIHDRIDIVWRYVRKTHG